MTVERSGGEDFERALALLWRNQPRTGPSGGKRSRGRKPSLTVDQIVRAGITVADRDGLPSTSMARVAAELGVGVMSLYTYVPAKVELVDLMVDAVLLERDLPGPGDPRPTGWRAQLELYADRTRAAYQRHPWLRQAFSTLRPPLGPGLLAQQEYLLSALSGIGLSARQVTAAAGAIVTFVGAAAALETESVQAERATGQTDDAWWAARQSFWDDYFDVARYPAMTRVWNDGGFDASSVEATRAAYSFGLQVLLDGIQATAEADRSR